MKKNARKITSLLLAALCTGSMLLCACDKATEESETTVTTTAATTKETTETTESTAETTRNGMINTPYKKITLDGVKENHFVSTDYCYIESEKYVLLIDKDIDLPGDFAVVMDAIVDELEKQLGVSYAPVERDYPHVTDNSIYYNGFNPWKDWYVGEKIPVFIMCDRQPEGWISCATADDLTLVEYELFSEDVWNSIPDFRDNPWRKTDYVDYSVIAHEMTHVITGRNCNMSKIMTEGLADYMAVSVINALADKYPSIAEVKAKKTFYDNTVPEAVNASNAEAIFVSDYKDVSHADRGAEYTYGQYLFEYLHEQAGDDFFKKICTKLNTSAGFVYRYDEYNEEQMQKIAGIIKDLYGDDVFTKFGDWCVKNNHLQDTNN
ncbi:MAG: hypothetical protein II438_09460 [Clostridiales bacterium]|nr:hypothetical protein [Clostridiales bacterium]